MVTLEKCIINPGNPLASRRPDEGNKWLLLSTIKWAKNKNPRHFRWKTSVRASVRSRRIRNSS